MDGKKSDQLDGLVSPNLDGISSVDRETVLRCLKVIAEGSDKLKHRGLSTWRFFFGVANLLLVTVCFVGYPQHFWLLYTLEAFVLFAIRGVRLANAKPLSEVLYWLDYCWIVNFTCNLLFVLFTLDAYCNFGIFKCLDALDQKSLREFLFCAAFGTFCGPLLGAVGALGNALIFHDVDNTSSVFIHLFPSLLMYTLRWNTQDVTNTWPDVFQLNYFEEINPWSGIYASPMLFYAGWWFVYTVWLCTCGLQCPHKGYDTVFHSLMRPFNPLSKMLGWSKDEHARRAKENDFTVKSALVYMVFHSVAVAVGTLLAVGCFMSQYFHAASCATMALLAIYKGASRYSYYMLESYTNVLRKEFGESLKDP
eukprot:TRINITY_DN16759_c0_g3_i2.p1 TRINITY_DN16759_c0_g3~~TRINITY_DN16759_c0_g3_i2.p1  ORF type:complete len:365 (-),score=16.93 TRINITY_DN16759_c0_g3_i2:78-1172(-)